MKIVNCEQVSPEWWDAKRGLPTASDFDRICTPVGKKCALQEGHEEPHRVAEEGDKPKSKGRCQHTIMQLSEGADGYICELAASIIDQRPNYFTARGRPVSQAMQDGIDNEPAARKWYELKYNVDCHRVGLCLSDDERIGCSPDSLMPDAKRGLEIKCPELKTQLKYLLDGGLPNEYRMQVHGSLIVTGYESWDFFSYCPPAPPLLVRVVPDATTDQLRAVIADFLTQYDRTLARLGIRRPLIEQEAA